MSGAVGKVGGNPPTSPQSQTVEKPVVGDGESHEQVSERSRARSKAAGRSVVELQPRERPARTRVRQLLRGGDFEAARLHDARTVQMNASTKVEPENIGKEGLLDLADKSPSELEDWYDSASDGLKRRVQRAFTKIDPSKLDATERTKIQQLGERLNGLQLEHNQKWTVNHYKGMSEREIILELQNRSPKRIVEDLAYLSQARVKGGEQVRKKFVDALERGMRTRQPGTAPSVNYPMISPGHVYEAAVNYSGPGASAVKAQTATMLYHNIARSAEGRFREPDPKLKRGGAMMRKAYDAKMKEVAKDRQAYIRSELGKQAPRLKRLMGAEPGAFVQQMENLKDGPKVFPEILTAVARHEYDRDPEKGAQFIGKVIGSTAADFGRSVAGSDWKKARSMGNDLGFVLGAAEIAIDNVAGEEHEKVDFGRKVLGFATDAIKKSKIPGASQIAEVGEKAIDEMARQEKGQIDGWRDKIFFGFKALIDETYDKVSPNGSYPVDSPEGRTHQENQDVYEVGYQERYREIKKGF